MLPNLKNSLFALFLAFGAAGSAMADSLEVLVDAGWARASIGTSRPAAAYITFRNTGGKAVTLTGLTTAVAKRAEVHLTQTDDAGVSTMSPAGDIALPPGEDVTFQPGGLHIMLMGLNAPLKEGERFELTLEYDDGGSKTVEVNVLGVAARGPEN